MAKNKKNKIPFYKNKNNIITMILAAAMIAFLFTYRFEQDNLTGAERIWNRLSWGVERVAKGCAKPPEKEVEAYYKDNAGAIPVDPDFDADPGEICGNGRKYYCTSLPPDKPVPLSWKKPPRPGEDPDYEGPSPFDVFKESPHAMPSNKSILTRAPIRDRRDRDLVRSMDSVFELYGAGKIGMFAPEKASSQLAKYRDQIVPVDPFLFETDDDEKLAKQLETNGIDYVLYDRTLPLVKPWIEEKMGTVRIRMRDAVSLNWFQPMVVGSRYALFKRTTPFEIPKHVKRRLTKRVRAILEGKTPEAFDFTLPTDGLGDSKHRVIVSLRKRSEPKVKGRKLIRRIAHDSNLMEAVDGGAKRLKEDWADLQKSVKKDYDVSISDDIAKEVADMEIELDVLYHHCYLTDRSPRNLLWYLELGLEGIILKERKKDGSIYYLEPSYGVQMETEKEIVFLERMLKKARLNKFLRKAKDKKIRRKRGQVLHEAKWQKDEKYDFKRFRTVNWVERPQKDGGDIVEIYRGVPLKTIWDVSFASLVKSLELGAGWLMNNQSEDGQYKYKYTPTNKPGRRWMPGGNIVRHALNPYTLLMVNKIKQNEAYVKSAKRGIEFTLKFLRHKGNRCAICHRDPPARYYNAKLNAVAVTILSILKLGDVADISEYKDDLACMAEEMLFMQDKNGHFWQYDVPPDHPYYGAESTIHAGEFIFVLARLYSHYKEERFKIACDKAIDFYMKQWEKLVSERTPNGIYDEEHRVNLIGIVPWLVTAMEDLHKMTGDSKYADLAFRTQDWIDDEFFWWQNRAQYPDYVGASFKVHRELPAVNSCQYAEGASAAYAIAKRTGRDVEKRRQVVVHSMRYCLQLQYDSYDSTFFLPEAKPAMGGYRYTLGHLRLRNDYNYHAMAAIAQAAEYLEPEDYPAQRPLRILPVLSELLGGQANPEKDMTLAEYRAKQEALKREKEAAEAARLAAETAENQTPAPIDPSAQ